MMQIYGIYTPAALFKRGCDVEEKALRRTSRRVADSIRQIAVTGQPYKGWHVRWNARHDRCVVDFACTPGELAAIMADVQFTPFGTLRDVAVFKRYLTDTEIENISNLSAKD